MHNKNLLLDIYEFINTCISLDKTMKNVNNYYMEIGYPVFNGIQTDYTNIYEFDFISKNAIDVFETKKEYKELRENIEDPEVEIFINRLLSDAKTGTMPFNDSALNTKYAAKELIFKCLAIGVEPNPNDATIDITKKLYNVCEQELKTYNPYIASILDLVDRKNQQKEENKNPKSKI